MGVRLNKVLTELNIGLQTAVDYLKKKNLGDITDATVNTKISDEQYNALVKEFKGDKDVKTQAGMMFPKKDKKAKNKITVSKKGVVTVKKGLKKGKYTIYVNVTAAGNSSYAPMTKKVRVKISVR